MGATLSPGEGVAGKVIETAQSTIIPDCQKDPRWAGKVDKKTGFCTKTMICVPLCVDEMAFGSIQIINKVDGLPFDNLDLEFTEKLAEAAATMLTDQELLRGYVAYAGRLQTDTITYESIVCAPTKREMERVLHRTNCYQLLTLQEKKRVTELTGELYEVFEKAQVRNEGKAPKKGFFGGRR